MELSDILGSGGHTKRPDHPDFWRLSEIIMQLKADQAEAKDVKEQERLWRARYEAVGDFDSIAYHAIQAAIHLHNIHTGADWLMLTADRRRHESYIKSVQAFFDGFIMGAEFERRGGHQEMP